MCTYLFRGFTHMEEANMLKTIRMFATKGLVDDQEFEQGEDDLAFVISHEVELSGTTSMKARDNSTGEAEMNMPLSSSLDKSYKYEGNGTNNTVHFYPEELIHPEVAVPSIMAGDIPPDVLISIAHDVMVLPYTSSPKQRLSVSYAIAQSSVLSVFESRVQQKIEQYKYMPEVTSHTN